MATLDVGQYHVDDLLTVSAWACRRRSDASRVTSGDITSANMAASAFLHMANGIVCRRHCVMIDVIFFILKRLEILPSRNRRIFLQSDEISDMAI